MDGMWFVGKEAMKGWDNANMYGKELITKDLLEALRDLTWQFETTNVLFDRRDQESLDRARAVIARAEGTKP